MTPAPLPESRAQSSQDRRLNVLPGLSRESGGRWALRLNRRDGRVDFSDPRRSSPPANAVRGVAEGKFVWLSGCELGEVEIAVHRRGRPDNIVAAYTMEVCDPDAEEEEDTE